MAQVVDVQYNDETVVENKVAEFDDSTFLSAETIQKWQNILNNQ